MPCFKGQTIVVTGAGGGIGAAIARGAAAEGANTIWVDTSTDVRQLAEDAGGIPLVGDVRDQDLPGQVEHVLEHQGWDLDHLVGAAGIQVRTPAAGIAESDWQRLLDINLSGLYGLIRGLVPALSRGSHGSAGSVVAVTSMSADRAVPGIVPYGAVKAGLSHLIRGLAVELGPVGVRLNAIAPGYVDTPMTTAVLSQAENRQRILARLPLGRIADPEEMVGPVLFLMSAEASYVTGQILGVDGGYALT